MNDFSELERELRKLKPRAVSPGLLGGVAEGLAVEEKVVRPARFRMNWIGLGAGLAAAATFIFLARVDFRAPRADEKKIAAASSNPAVALNYADYRASGLTKVVYDRRDEGLVFPGGSAVPARQVRTATRESFQWRNPTTGARLRVTYPAEEVMLVPVSGQ